jgi:hypothetical protein
MLIAKRMRARSFGLSGVNETPGSTSSRYGAIARHAGARRCPHQRRRAVDRSPGDLDYRLVVVRDCCADPDAEVHSMLLDIVIAKQAAVVTTAELAGALPGRSS